MDKIINLSGDELEKYIESVPVNEYYPGIGEFENNIIITDHIFFTTNITPVKMMEKILPASWYIRHGSENRIKLIKYIIENYIDDVNEIDNENIFINIYLIDTLIDNGLDVNIITSEKIILLLENYLKHSYKGHGSNPQIILKILQVVNNNNSAHLNDFFANIDNCNLMMNILLKTRSYSRQLFLFFIENGLKIYKNPIIDHINYLKEYFENTSISTKFIIDLLKTFRSSPEIFYDNVNDAILYLAVNFSTEKVLKYITESDIAAEEIKAALRTCGYNNNGIGRHRHAMIRKYQHELDIEEIVGLCMGPS